jgi:hypothetical protein
VVRQCTVRPCCGGLRCGCDAGHEAQDVREASEGTAELGSGKDLRVRSPRGDRTSRSVDQVVGYAAWRQA